MTSFNTTEAIEFVSPYGADDRCRCGAVVDFATETLNLHWARRAGGDTTIVVVGCSMCGYPAARALRSVA